MHVTRRAHLISISYDDGVAPPDLFEAVASVYRDHGRSIAVEGNSLDPATGERTYVRLGTGKQIDAADGANDGPYYDHGHVRCGKCHGRIANIDMEVGEHAKECAAEQDKPAE